MAPCTFVDSCGQKFKCGPTWFGTTELLLTKYYRTDGVRVGTATSAASDERVKFDFNATPRVTLGVIGEDGLGLRGQWFEYSHAEDANVAATNINPPGQRFAIDAYTVDLEVFEEFQVHENWGLELSGGFRHSGFEEVMRDNAEIRTHDFNGIGPVVGIEARRRFLGGRLYGRFQAATLFGDKHRDNDSAGDTEELRDSIHTQLEIAGGFRAERPLGKAATLSWWAGFESADWLAFSSNFNNDGGTIREGQWSGNADVGFASFVFGLGIAR